MNFISKYIDDFLENQAASMIKSGLTAAIVWVIVHVHANGLVAPTSAQTWAAALTTMIVTAAVHFVDQHFSNANVPAVNVTLASPQAGANVPNAVTPLPTATGTGGTSSIPSPTLSEPPQA